MSALICGSFAYDNIMVFHDRFKNHILPDKVHVLSVSFLVPEMRQEFGGCAGNIAYNMALLGVKGLPMATVGKNFERYGKWMDEHGINRKYVTVIDSEFTAQAFITTDLDDNQITAFHPGAMNHAHLNKVTDADGVDIGIVSPDGREGMIQHAAQFAEAGIPFIFDPGQGLPMFDGDDLVHFIDQATWVTVNDYEWELISERTGLARNEVEDRVEALIITQGGKGSEIHVKGRTISIPVARPSENADPTGCGDAYRAGLLYGLLNDMDWETAGRIASLMGAIKIARHGTQNHRFEFEEFEDRFEEAFGRSMG
jgi:adenosine kinase